MGRIDDTIDRIAAIVTAHNRLVLLVMLVATAGVLMGIPQIEAEQEEAFGDELETQTEVGEAAEYVDDNYADEDDEPTATSNVYVRDDTGNALSQAALLEALEYQQEVTESDAVADSLEEDGVVGPPNAIAMQLAGDPDADVDEQIEALEAADDDEVAAVVERTFTGGEATQAFLPASYESGTAEAESFRMQFEFEVDEAPENQLASPPEDAQRTLFEAAEERDDPDVFTLGEFAQEPWIEQQQSDTVWLILPPALVLVLAVLAFAYRDVVDVLIGFVGVVVSVLWMFGILGWLGIPAGMTIIIGPVLIVALSIDFGLHVFMRYREHRGPEDGIREAMSRSTGSVAVAFLLVALTAAIGFLSNLTSPLSMIRELGIGITLGVLSAFVIFVTLVPALKIGADGLLERFGFDRRKTALGKGRYLRPVLSSGVHVARRAAPVVVVVALVAGTAGGLAYADIDRQGFQQDIEVADWKTELPGPMAWEAADTEYQQNLAYEQEQYQGDHEFTSSTRFLVDGDPTDPETLEAVADGHAAADDSDVTYSQGGEVAVLSPLSVMAETAATDEEFAEVYHGADTTGDGVPNQDVDEVYDALFDAAPEQAEQVIERTDDGEYRTLLVHVPVQQGLDVGEQGDAMHDIADEMEDGSAASVTPVGVATLNNAELAVLADDIMETMLIALAGVLVALAAIYRFERDSALLGALTVVPIALVVGLVIGSMSLFGVPLTFVTALLMSITIGLGIDYNIHVSDRFAQALERGADPATALYTAVTGTGGALLGSALTSGAAFATLLLHPGPQIRSFGAIVVLALALSFLLSVFVLPSLLYLWATRVAEWDAAESHETRPSVADND
ncbi:RND transporter [Natronococcus pandeyae]|uniref:RND transporter n=1 Tax=Natronococcus pandeyae TaxID=2055836 RepID=A0A8J8TQ20_9EURY|nr:MMPL family transporter [Natronococcus pandeyae]TYL38018.1 RND transporter [Natronococcus pandeyae]